MESKKNKNIQQQNPQQRRRQNRVRVWRQQARSSRQVFNTTCFTMLLPSVSQRRLWISLWQLVSALTLLVIVYSVIVLPRLSNRLPYSFYDTGIGSINRRNNKISFYIVSVTTKILQMRNSTELAFVYNINETVKI
jgi:hypothetical protein